MTNLTVQKKMRPESANSPASLLKGNHMDLITGSYSDESMQ